MTPSLFRLIWVVFFIMVGRATATEALLAELEKANQLYEAEQYEAAIEHYQAIIAQGIENPLVYYNLGNAFFKSNQLGNAILSYERARRLAPRDEDILVNLEFTRAQIVDRVELPDEGFLINSYHFLLTRFTVNEVLRVGYVIYLLLILNMALWILVRRFRRWLVYPLVLFFVLTLMVGGFCYLKIQHDQVPTAVVMVTQTNVMTGPGENLQVAFKVHEGTILSILETRGEWVEVVLAGKLRGWVKKETLVEV
ncbi:MAG: tetratricopeptide repeat protein [Gemmatimonadetes bacterium]|nr:MAG: tetratricopeptide repeat protein [Gemmatimonadota bacterium]